MHFVTKTKPFTVLNLHRLTDFQDPEALPPTLVDPEALPPTLVDPEALPPTLVDPEALPSTFVDPEALPPALLDPVTLSDFLVEKPKIFSDVIFLVHDMKIHDFCKIG